MEIQHIVATNLARARGDMSRKELAKRAKVSYQHIYEIEEEIKKPSLKVLERISKALKIDLYKLLEPSATLTAKSLTVGGVISKMIAVPDEVYDLAPLIPKDDETWKDIINMLKERDKTLRPRKSNHS